MPLRKNIKISSAKRGHHERHKKKLFKSKKTISKEKKQKEDVFKSKREFVSRRNFQNNKKLYTDIHNDSNYKNDLENRLVMMRENKMESDNASDETNNAVMDDTETMEIQYRLQNDIDLKNEETRELLPIKTKYGLVPREASHIQKSQGIFDIDHSMDNDEEEEENQDSDEDILNSLDQIIKTKDVNKLSTADLLVERNETIESYKFKIGVLCSGILEKPEEKIKNLTTLLNMIDEKNKDGQINFFSIRKLAILSIMETFRDIIPEYRVGVVDLETQKVKKVTLQRINYEKDLLGYYKRFLVKMERLISKLKVKRFQTMKATKEDKILAELSVHCLCELILEHPYFNFSTNIGQLLVALLNIHNDNIRAMVHKTFCSIFKTDKRLDLTRHIVRHINGLIKKNQNIVHFELVSCLLSLQIKNINLDAEKENELKKKKIEAHKSRVINLSKREKKRKKKLADLERELLETQAEENKQTKNSKLIDIMKLTFTIYFRILKQTPNTKILSATLEGLAKFAHMINIEFFSDLVDVLYKLLHNEDLGYREQLHCVQTVFTILSGQGEVLNIDPARFYSHLYKNLLEVHSGKSYIDAESMLITVENILVKRRKHITSSRSLAFIKRLMILSMQLLHNGALSCLSIIKSSLQLNNQLDVLLDTEQHVGSGKYDPSIDEPEYCNANCTNLYEIGLMYKHYHPTVRKYINYIALGVPITGKGILTSDIAKLSPAELFEQFDSKNVSFNPVIPIPKKTYIPISGNLNKNKFVNSEIQNICKKAWNNCRPSKSIDLKFFCSLN